MIALSHLIMQDIFVIDNFYSDPYKVREFARNLNYTIKFPTPDWKADGIENLWPGSVATELLTENKLDIKVSKILQKPVRAGYKSGFFRLSKANDPYQAYAHTDGLPDKTNKKHYQGVVYLSLPEHSDGKLGTYFLEHKETGLKKLNSPQDYWRVLPDYVNKDCWNIYLSVENKFNRLLLFDYTYFHGLGDLFGSTFDDARLTQILHFDEI